jgi:GNAT superfamily N-acetyltransferase
MPSTAKIRTAGSDEAGLLAELIRSSFRDVAERFGLTLRNCPSHPSNCTAEWIQKDWERGVTFYILENGFGPVGCVALEKASPELCYLERLAVLPAERGQGYGKLLAEHVFSLASAMGTQAVSIAIIAEQSELKQWYEKLGFVEKETKTYPHLPFRVMFMHCDLLP